MAARYAGRPDHRPPADARARRRGRPAPRRAHQRQPRDPRPEVLPTELIVRTSCGHHHAGGPDDRSDEDHRAALLLAAAALALTGCGRDEGGGADGAAQQSRPSPRARPPARSTVWAMGTEGELLGDFADGVPTANPDATVKVTAIPWDAAHDKIATAIAGRRDPRRHPGRHHLDGRVRRGRRPRPDPGRPASTRPTSSRAPGARPRSAARRTASRGTSRPASSTTARTWPRRPAVRGPDHLGRAEDRSPRTCRTRPAPSTASACQPAGTGSWQTFMPFAWQAGGNLINDGRHRVHDRHPGDGPRRSSTTSRSSTTGCPRRPPLHAR